MALITQADLVFAGRRTRRVSSKSARIPATQIPLAATHVVWFHWSDGTYVYQFADTERSAKLQYGKFSDRWVGMSFGLKRHIDSAGWAVIDPQDRIDGKVL